MTLFSRGVFVSALALWLCLLASTSDADYACTTTTPAAYSGKTSVFGWGSNARKQLSASSPFSVTLPLKLTIGSRSNNVTKISGGFLHNAILDAVFNTAWLNGNAESGQLGAGPYFSTYRSEYLPVPFVINSVEPVAFDGPVYDAACGMDFTCFVAPSPNATTTTRGIVYCSGSNNKGQLGRSDIAAKSAYFLPVSSTNDAFRFASFIAVAAGSDHVVALTTTGLLWAWGSNTEGSLGNGQTVDSVSPVLVTLTATVVKVGCGLRYCIAMTAGGALYGWGQNDQYQLGGASNRTREVSPVRILASGVTNFACGGAHVLAIVNNRLFSWGAATMGQTGHPKNIPASVSAKWYVTTPTQIAAFANVNIVSISAGSKHSIALDACGTVYTFGSDAEGQLGTGKASSRKNQFRRLLPVINTAMQARSVRVVGVYTAWFNSYAVTVETAR